MSRRIYAYLLMRAGDPWDSIASKLRFKDVGEARAAAAEYATEANLPWPDKLKSRRMPHSHAPTPLPATESDMHERILSLCAEGKSLTDISRLVTTTLRPRWVVEGLRPRGDGTLGPYRPDLDPLRKEMLQERDRKGIRDDAAVATLRRRLDQPSIDTTDIYDLFHEEDTPQPAPDTTVKKNSTSAKNPPPSPAANTPKIVTELPLSDIAPLAGLYGLANRYVRMKKVREMAAEWDDNACGILAVFQEAPGKPYHIVSGHHRHQAMLKVCEKKGVSPKSLRVRVDVLTPADVPSGMTPRDYILKLVKKYNGTSEQEIMDDLANEQLSSPWVAAAAKAKLNVEFNASSKTEYTWSSILRAYINVKTAYAMAATDGGFAAASSFKLSSLTDDEAAEAFFRPNLDDMRRVIEVIKRWETRAGEKLANPAMTANGRARRVVLRSAYVLAFLLLVEFDPQNTALRRDVVLDLPDRFVNPSKPPFTPDKTDSLPEAINRMLKHANDDRSAKNRVTVFGAHALPIPVKVKK
jgi:hypothetical protein